MTLETETAHFTPLPEGIILNEAYQVMNVLGLGGFGITYLAWDTARERHVVVKECLPGDYATREEGTNRVHPISDETAGMFADCLVNARQEAEMLSRINHQGVVAIYDLFDQNGTFYYVMELIQGKTLYEIMMALRENGQLMPAAQVESLMVYVLEILEVLHQQKIYHCDIKPGNIFILPDGKPKLIDFGAVRSKELQHEGLVQITPGYTPPEFYPGNLRELGPWSDVYELGATFYELLTGQVPEPGDQRFKVDRMPRISSNELLRKTYPLPLLSSLEKALAPDHKNRFATARDWIEYLDGYGGGRQIKTVNPHSAVGRRMRQSTMPGTRKKKKNYTPLMMLVVLLLVAGGFLYGVKEGKINIDEYPELNFIKEWLGMPVDDAPKGGTPDVQGTQQQAAANEDPATRIDPGSEEPSTVKEPQQEESGAKVSPVDEVIYEEEIITAEE